MAKSFEYCFYLFFTKFAASVFLDLLVKCYYGILKYNYKHFINVKGFYWLFYWKKLSDKVHAKSQHLQCRSFFFKTTANLPGMLINFWANSWVMAAHSNRCFEFVRFLGVLFVDPFLEDWPQIFGGIKDWGVSWPWTTSLWAFDDFDDLFPKLFSYHLCLMARCSTILFFSKQAFFQMPQTIEKEIHQRNDFTPVLSSPIPMTLTPGHPPKVFASLCMQMYSHLLTPATTSAEQALHWWCPNPIAESTFGDGLSACWTSPHICQKNGICYFNSSSVCVEKKIAATVSPPDWYFSELSHGKLLSLPANESQTATCLLKTITLSLSGMHVGSGS